MEKAKQANTAAPEPANQPQHEGTKQPAKPVETGDPGALPQQPEAGQPAVSGRR